MDKKILKENITNMKFLMGYQIGKVISEQEQLETKDDLFLRRRASTIEELIDKNIEKVYDEGGYGFSDEYEFADNIISWVVQDLTTSDYSDHDYDKLTDLIKDEFGEYILSQYVEEDFDDEDDDEDNLFEQEEPETDRYMFFSNLEQIHRQTGILLEKDPQMISDILENGHDWAQDHIATSKESIDQVFDFLMNEEKGDGEEMFEGYEYDDVISEENNETLRKQLHTLVGNEMKLGKKADMSGADHHKEDHKKAEKELKDFLKDNPSMEKYQDEVEEHFYKLLFEEMFEGYEYDDVDELNPDDFNDDEESRVNDLKQKHGIKFRKDFEGSDDEFIDYLYDNKDSFDNFKKDNNRIKIPTDPIVFDPTDDETSKLKQRHGVKFRDEFDGDDEFMDYIQNNRGSFDNLSKDLNDLRQTKRNR
jgi:hypothetical protein